MTAFKQRQDGRQLPEDGEIIMPKKNTSYVKGSINNIR
jgi:hypothetical protein